MCHISIIDKVVTSLTRNKNYIDDTPHDLEDFADTAFQELVPRR